MTSMIPVKIFRYWSPYIFLYDLNCICCYCLVPSTWPLSCFWFFWVNTSSSYGLYGFQSRWTCYIWLNCLGLCLLTATWSSFMSWHLIIQSCLPLWPINIHIWLTWLICYALFSIDNRMRSLPCCDLMVIWAILLSMACYSYVGLHFFVIVCLLPLRNTYINISHLLSILIHLCATNVHARFGICWSYGFMLVQASYI